MYVLSTNIVANQLCCYRCHSSFFCQTYEFSGACNVQDGSFVLSSYLKSKAIQSCFKLTDKPSCIIGNVSSLNFSNNQVTNFDPGLDCSATANNAKLVFARDCIGSTIHSSGYNSVTCNFYDFVMVNNTASMALFCSNNTSKIYMENIIVFGAIPKIITNLAKTTTLIANSWFEQKPQSVMYFSEQNNHYATVMPQDFYGRVPIDLCFTDEAADSSHYYIICFGGSLLIPTLSMNI